jgi:glycosyltransferase involved in cell wall biosynthesis
VVWVGRDVPGKRLPLALEAAALAGCELVVVGASPSPAPSGVCALGALSRAEALGLIARADALLSTSAVEGAPTAVREARAYGVPVVACAAGDLERWALDDPGIRVVDDDPAALAHALRTLGVQTGTAVSGGVRRSRTP